MGDPQQIEHPVQLLVEGKDDANFFRAMLTHLSITGVQLQDYGGVKALRGFLLAFVNLPDFHHRVQSIGIVQDAERSAQSAFRAVRSAVENAGLSPAEKPLERSGASPSVTVLILPDSGQAGMLETLLCRTFVDSDVNRCIDGFFACFAQTGGELKKPEKARAHAYLATRSDPHVSVGIAAQKGYWRLDHHALTEVRSFLRQL